MIRPHHPSTPSGTAHPGSASRSRGVALFEVLVAVLLFSLGCLAIAKTMETIFFTETILREQETLTHFLDQEIKTIAAATVDPPEVDERTVTLAGRTATIRIQTQPLSLPREDHPTITLLAVTITAEIGDQSETITFWRQPAF